MRILNLDKYKYELQQYCSDNNLDYDKLMSAVKGFGDNEMAFYVASSTNNEQGLNNETPARIILTVRKMENKIQIAQTEYAKQYLSKCRF